jgi:hypothetical protein
MFVSLTRVSSNVKTGPIPTSTSSRETCPATCPFYDKGCYAKSGPQAIHWRKTTAGERGYNWQEFVKQIRSLHRGQLWRHNVAGDLPHNNGMIDQQQVMMLVEANKGRRGYTYSHHVLNDHNVDCLQIANANGFTVNVSTESVESADQVMTEHNLPAVAVVNSAKTDRFYRTESGRKVITCPATIHENVTCATCGLCAKSDRDFIIAFPAHGTAKKTVNEIVG